MAIVPGKGIPLWKALLRELLLSDGMVYCHPISKVGPISRHTTGFVIHDPLCPEIGRWVRTKKCSMLRHFAYSSVKGYAVSQ